MDDRKRIGDYEILEKLGSGGMGEVYRVRHTISDRHEAMKVLLPNYTEREDLAARFLREIKVLAALSHPHIAALRTAFKADNQLVMIMELVEGQALSKRVQQGAIVPNEAMHYVDQVLDALAYAHAQQVVHRDIKPANMMVTPKGVVKLTDFGIARSAQEQTLTVAGATAGSLGYMSPEQINGQAIDARSDLYAVGISLYEMVTGQLPFKANSDFSVMLAHLNEAPRPPIELQPSLPPELNALILKAIAKNPAERYQSAAEFRTALRTVAAAQHAARQPAAAAVPVVPVAVAAASAPATPAVPSHAMSQQPPSATPPLPPNLGQIPVRPPKRHGVHPAVYIALGAFLMVATVAGIAYYSRTAEANPPAKQASPLVTETPPAPEPVTPAISPSPAATVEPTPTPQAPLTSASPSAPVETGPRTPPSGVTPARPAPARTALTDQPPSTRPSRAATPAPAQPAEAPPAAPAAPARDAAREQEILDDLESQVDALSARANAVNSSLDRLKSAQAAAGYGLRGDMAARQTTLNLNLSRAAEAVERRDIPRAQKFLGLADADLAVLERFLGR